MMARNRCYIVNNKLTAQEIRKPICDTVFCVKYKRRYTGNATITKHKLPEAPTEGEMRNK